MDFLKNIKRYIFVLTICLFFCHDVLADSPVTVYTPEGRPVTAYVISNGTPENTNQIVQDLIDYFGLDAEIIGNATAYYNCHGYAWSKSENSGTYWIGYYAPNNEELKYFNDSAWANDGKSSYTILTGADTVNATHGSYMPFDWSDHTVRVIQNGYPVAASGSQTHVSKWGDGPLVRHAPRNDIYQIQYQSEPDFSGNVPIQYSVLKTDHSGTLSNYPKTWIGAGGKTHTITSTVTVPSGVTLTIKAGATVKIAPDANLIVYGKIIAKGTASQPITFKRKNTWDKWGKILLYGDNNDFEYCTFDGGTYNVQLNSSENNTFDHCVFKLAQERGLDIYNHSEALIKNSEFYWHYYPLYVSSYNDVILIGNDFHNSDYGIYSSTGNYILGYGNVIEDHMSYGLKTANSDNIHFGVPGEWSGKNTIINNGYPNVYKYSGSPLLIFDEACIHTSSGCEIYVYGSPYISAMEVWWGGGSPNYCGGGTINNMYPLSSKPFWEGIPQNDMNPQYMYKSAPGISNENLPDRFRGIEGVSALKNKLQDKAVSDNEKIEALRDLYGMLRADYRENSYSERERFYNFIEENILPNAKGEFADVALHYQALWMALQGKYNQAIHLYEKLLAVVNEDGELEVMVNLTTLYHLNGQDMEAKRMLSSISSKYGYEEELIANLTADISGDGSQMDKNAEAVQPKEFQLFNNYPNPFNPVTRISYSIPRSALVTLKIYDVLGRQIQTLVNEVQEANNYSVNFDATNLSSGIYFYTLQAGKDFVETKKMLLVR